MRLYPFAFAATLIALSAGCADESPSPSDDVVENHPGSLVVTSPERASFLEDDGSEVEVRGTGATQALTINGAHAEVAPDGSFHARIKAVPGLNIVAAVDGESRLDTPFLFGHYLAADEPVAQAIALEVGDAGIRAKAPAASLTSVANLALEDRDLVGALRDKTFSGKVTAVNWTFEVNDGKNGKAGVALAPSSAGLGVEASIANVVVDGRLSLKGLGLSYAHDVTIKVTKATVAGDVVLKVDEDNGALGASMPNADTTLDGFRFDTDNAGFPCCVDTILSTVMKGKIEDAIASGIRSEVPKLIRLTLDGLGVPDSLDLSVAKIDATLPIETKFDGAAFGQQGGTITAALHFGGPVAKGGPAAKAPGSLVFGRPYRTGSPSGSLGASLSLDAVNQLLFATWATGKATFTIPDPLNATLAPALPPVVAVADGGALRIALGEVRVQRAGSPAPMAAVSVVQDIVASGDAGALVLTPKGKPTISITWLTDEIEGAARDLIAVAAKEQLEKFLKPFRIPIPTFALDALGEALKGQSLGIDSPAVRVDGKTARVGFSGTMMLLGEGGASAP